MSFSSGSIRTPTYLPTPAVRGMLAEHLTINNTREYLQLLKVNHLQTLVKVYCCADRILLENLKQVCITETNDAFPLLMYTGGSVHVTLQQIPREHYKHRSATIHGPRTLCAPACEDSGTTLSPLLSSSNLSRSVGISQPGWCRRTSMWSGRITRTSPKSVVSPKQMDALRRAQATLVQKASEAEAKCYNTVWRLRNFLRDETVCTKCGCEVTRNKMLVRLLHNQYAIDCQQCRHRMWHTLR